MSFNPILTLVRTCRITLWKELLVLSRDRIGLTVIFLMPLALVIVMTLIQHRVLESTSFDNLTIAILDQDRSNFSQEFVHEFSKNSGLGLQTFILDSTHVTPERFKQLILQGQYRVGILVPEKMGYTLENQIHYHSKKMLGLIQTSQEKTLDTIPIQILFEPIVHGSFRVALSLAIQQTLQILMIKTQTTILNRLIQSDFRESLQKQVEAELGEPLTSEDSQRFFQSFGKIKLELEPIGKNIQVQEVGLMPSALQHNIPAWSIFGMFFIVLPVAGAWVREKNSGLWERIQALKIPISGILLGKVSAALCVCGIQFSIILGLGYFALPYLGLTPLLLHSSSWWLIPITLVVSLSAGSYAILIGSLSKSYEQASMLGAMSVVIASALGGIMVPVYVMPTLFQKICIFSPLYWALQCYQMVFLHNVVGYLMIKNLLMLALFSLVCIVIGGYIVNPQKSKKLI